MLCIREFSRTTVVWLALLCVAHAQYYVRNITENVFQPPVTENGENTLFGYSMSYLESKQSLILGAPLASKVFLCNNSDTDKECVALKDPKFHELQLEKRSREFLLGASVVAASDYFVVCAPRNIENRTINHTLIRVFARCYIVQDLGNNPPDLMRPVSMRYIADRSLKDRVNKMTSFGWSAAMSPDQDSLMVGGPALGGRVELYQGLKRTDKLNIVPHDLIRNQNIAVHNYGYAVTCGYYFNEKELVFAVSSPYGVDGGGTVSFIKGTKILTKPIIRDEVAGRLFGACMCSVHLNDDKLSDLLVAAPLYSSNLKADHGAVFVYLTEMRTLRKHNVIIEGQKEGGHFGSTMAVIGDVNGDFTNGSDIAISAPYEDNGVVYIYSGKSLTTQNPRKLQRIAARHVQGFGLSFAVISTARGCSDLAVSAPFHNTVALLNCIRNKIIRINETISNNATIKLTDGSYKIPFQACVSIKPISSLDTDPFYAHLEMEIVVTNGVIDGETYLQSKILNFNTSKHLSEECMHLDIKVPDESVRNPVTYNITVRHLNPAIDAPEFDASLVKIINEENRIVFKSGHFWAPTECKDRNNCKPKLQMILDDSLTSNTLTVGIQTLTVTITVKNTGETAYDACAVIETVPYLPIRGCQGNFCKPKMRIQRSDTWSQNITVDISDLSSVDSGPIRITVNLFSKCSNPDEVKTQTLEYELHYDENLLVTGEPEKEEIRRISKEEILNLNPVFHHTYTIINKGITIWNDLKADVTLDSADLALEDVTIETKSETFQCEFRTNTNAICWIQDLRPEDKLVVHVPFKIVAKYDGKYNFTVNSDLTLYHRTGFKKECSVQTIILLHDSSVKSSTYIIGATIALVPIVVVVAILVKCGFFKRVNKAKLEELKDVEKRRSRIASTLRADSIHEQHNSVQIFDNQSVIGVINAVPDNGRAD